MILPIERSMITLSFCLRRTLNVIIFMLGMYRVFIHGINNYKKMRNQIYNVGLSDANLSKKNSVNESRK